MMALSRFWSWWTDTWRAPRRARLLYGVMAIAFGALAGVALARDDALVAALAGVATLAAVALAAFAPRLAKLTGSPLAEQGDPWETN